MPDSTVRRGPRATRASTPCATRSRRARWRTSPSRSTTSPRSSSSATGVTDPRNLGALLRSAECAGVTGVVLPRHRSARLTPAVTKTASGAIEHLGFAAVAGVPTALTDLSKLGVLTVGLAPEGRRTIYDLDLRDVPVALVIGGEEKGLSRLARTRCDEVVAIPQRGSIASLNAAVAGAVACFEVARQRAAAR